MKRARKRPKGKSGCTLQSGYKITNSKEASSKEGKSTERRASVSGMDPMGNLQILCPQMVPPWQALTGAARQLATQTLCNPWIITPWWYRRAQLSLKRSRPLFTREQPNPSCRTRPYLTQLGYWLPRPPVPFATAWAHPTMQRISIDTTTLTFKWLKRKWILL